MTNDEYRSKYHNRKVKWLNSLYGHQTHTVIGHVVSGSLSGRLIIRDPGGLEEICKIEDIEFIDKKI